MPTESRQPNERLRSARGARSQAQFAEQVNAEVQRRTRDGPVITAKYISDLECGWYSWPAKQTREALCTVCGVSSPAEIGLVPRRRSRTSRDDSAVVIGMEQEEPVDPMRRRTFVLGGIAAVSGAMLPKLPVRADDRYGFASSVTARWPDIRFSRSVPDGGADWQLGLPAGRAFGGAPMAVQVRPGAGANDGLVSVAVDPLRFGDFAQNAHRGLLVGARSSAGGRFYAIDSREARRQAQRSPSRPTVMIPAAYELDDLTYAAVWAVTNLDDALLGDDAPLWEHRRQLAQYEQLTHSAVSREEVGDLAAVSQMWLGSDFCARHIVRNLGVLDRQPLFWTREQRGEEASPWLLWRHKLAYLQRTSRGGVARGFCIPEAQVAASPRYERALLFLSAALMEANGIQVRVTDEPSYGEVEGFVLGGKAIIANWVRASGIWHVDTTAGQMQRAAFADTSAYVRAHSILSGPVPSRRLAALADYLGLPRPWLRRRCGQLGAHGFARLVTPRSRLLTTNGLDIAARYVGSLDAAF